MSEEKLNRQSILNYTTAVSTERTVGEITELLVQAKAKAILTEFDDGILSALSFRIGTEFGVLTFRLPARVEQVHRILARSSKVPPRLRTREQAANSLQKIGPQTAGHGLKPSNKFLRRSSAVGGGQK